MSNWTYNDGLSDDEFTSQGTPENPILVNDPPEMRTTRKRGFT